MFDAIEQYRRDRNPREKLRAGPAWPISPDENEVQFCTHLRARRQWFLPFKGYNDGAGNPPNPQGLKIDYLWQRYYPRESD